MAGVRRMTEGATELSAKGLNREYAKGAPFLVWKGAPLF